MRHEILDVAASCDLVDVEQLRAVIDDGRARGQMMRTYVRFREHVRGSPHFFLADGSDVHNPGIALHHEGGTPVVDADDPSVYDALVRRAAGAH